MRAATSVSDRLVLLREWARLSDGYLGLSANGLELEPEEAIAAPRFGLDVDAGWVRINTFVACDLPAEAELAFRLDSSYRRMYPPGTPDGALRRWSAHWAYQSETQKAAVRALLSMPAGATLMVSMPTGTGKSLLFQMAPRAWAKPNIGTCVAVITPTIALALDHERTLRSMPGLEASRALTGQLSPTERDAILNGFRRGEVPILLLSPEQAFGSARQAILEAARHPDEKPFGVSAHLISFFIDEAHIVESWGRSFRPDFQRLPGLVAELRGRNPALRTILLSATLGAEARKTLERAYRGDDWLEIHAGVPRYEFDMAASSYTDRAERDRALYAVVDHAPRPAIVYTNLVEDADGIYAALRIRGYERIALFTGDVTRISERQSIIDRWAADEIDLVVATSAFGMGIDKADVRAVIHASLPESPARYYQEIGRAARDGHQGAGACLWTRDFPESDEDQAFGMAASSWISRDIAFARWAGIRELIEAQGAIGYVGSTRRARVDLDALREGLGSKSGDYNRRWNMSLINLLQRAGVVRVASVEEGSGSATWEIDIIDDALFGTDEAIDELWNRVEALRDREQATAIAEMRAFRDLMLGRADGRCQLAGVYALIDREATAVPDCGRCKTCRARGARGPTVVRSGGVDVVWRTAKAPRFRQFPPGVTVVEPESPEAASVLASIVPTLSRLGVEQYVVPDGYGPTCADLLAPLQSRLGFVLERADLVARGWALADLPTAVLFERTDHDVERLWRKLRRFTEDFPSQTAFAVAWPGVRVEGRPFPQVASRHAPYPQHALDEFVDALVQN